MLRRGPESTAKGYTNTLDRPVREWINKEVDQRALSDYSQISPLVIQSPLEMPSDSGVHLLPLFTPSSPLVKTSSRVGKPPDGASCSPCHPQVLHPLLTFRGGASAGFPRPSSPLRGERQGLVLRSVAGCAGFTAQGS